MPGETRTSTPLTNCQNLLSFITECIELLFGESIVARDEATVILSAGRGLGPPDLCWLQKATLSALTGAKSGEPGGYYHHALGRDVSSSAAVAAYFASITMRVEAVPWMRGALDHKPFTIAYL